MLLINDFVGGTPIGSVQVKCQAFLTGRAFGAFTEHIPAFGLKLLNERLRLVSEILGQFEIG